MTDVFKRYLVDLANTDSFSVFSGAVPVANASSTPPSPVSTYVLKNLTVHNTDGSNSVLVTVTHNDGSTDFEVDKITVTAGNTTTKGDVVVFQGGDELKVSANAGGRAIVSVSLLDIQQQI